ncbi:hypothetical protein VNI00_015231 [Paramarasmius palmivorus]|uniref:Uncharacterized protein n=1 Tax=Paramarasmius palmivorus TaxID=297713 RepID=A0AAW0BM42_9AGAR
MDSTPAIGRIQRGQRRAGVPLIFEIAVQILRIVIEETRAEGDLFVPALLVSKEYAEDSSPRDSFRFGRRGTFSACPGPKRECPSGHSVRIEDERISYATHAGGSSLCAYGRPFHNTAPFTSPPMSSWV